MRDFSQVKNILGEQKISSDDQEIVEDFLSHFSFAKRQQLMGIFIGWPEKVRLFIDLVKKKKALAENYDAVLAGEILDMENRELNNLTQQLQ